jgi:hypothetical protein
VTERPVYREDQPWYHGSPLELVILRTGSTITQDKELARIFSHKPSIVACADDGMIKHNGCLPGFLYVVEDLVEYDDIYPHPHTSMEISKEWLTRRDIRLRLLGVTSVDPEELLREDDLAAIKKRLESR